MHFSFKSPMSKFTGYSCKQQSPSAIRIVNYFQLNGFHLKRATKDSEQNKTKKIEKQNRKKTRSRNKYMSYFAYACKTEGKNDISHLISGTA